MMRKGKGRWKDKLQGREGGGNGRNEDEKGEKLQERLREDTVKEKEEGMKNRRRRDKGRKGNEEKRINE
jgi:hypothetical protein